MLRVRTFDFKRFFRALIACVLVHTLASAICAETGDARSGGASIEWPASGALSFHDGDTLEFTLRLPPALIENAPEDANPSVAVWLAEADPTVPIANAPQSGRVLILRSARAGEWIVQVRGASPPVENKALELIAQWSFIKADGVKATGELRFPGRVAFGSKPVDIVLLMDGSWSMELSDPKRKRVAAVRDFIATARGSSAIGRVGIVQFDTKAKTLIGLTPVSENFDKAIDAIGTNGMTDIDGGVRHALNLIEPERRNGASIVLFTDGVQEPGEYRNAHIEAVKAGVAIHTMTLGADADRKLLKRIAEETGGSYADADKDNDISAAYAAIVSRITRLHTIATAEFNGTTRFVRIPVDSSCSALSLTTVAEQPGSLKLQIPDGTHWSSGDALNPQNFVERPARGEWTSSWDANGGAALGATAQFSATARTSLYPLLFRASPLPAAPVEFDANDPRLALSLFDKSEPVTDATIEARFDFAGQSENGTVTTEHASARLSDDGKHVEGIAGPGIYAADIDTLEFLSRFATITKGTLSIVATGTRDGEPFRREMQSPFIVKRSAPPALLVSGAYDFGEKFAGETATGDVNLRARGARGAFKASFENTPEKLAAHIRFMDPPDALKTKEKRAQRLEIKLPERLPPGEYGGLAVLTLEGLPSVKVPWRVKVLPVEFRADPARIDLGAVFPGSIVKRKLKLATIGGTMQIATVAAPFLSQKAFDPSVLDKAGREIELEFLIPETTQAIQLNDAIVFRDAANVECTRVPLSLSVLSVRLLADAKLDFGAVEAGDVLSHEIVLRWDSSADVPIVPRLSTPGSALTPTLSPLVRREKLWTSTFTLAVPVAAASGALNGSINIEAGPFKSALPWSAKVVRPRLDSDTTALDFGRVFASRKSERSIVFRADTVRAVDVEFFVDAPLRKPRVAGVEMPASALAFSKKFTIQAGVATPVQFTLTVPDDAQDGRYETVLRATSRLGNIEIPLSVKVVNVVDAAAFHVTPTSMNFKITEGEALPLETLQIVSHDDEPLPVVLSIPTLQSAAQNLDDPAGVLPTPAPLAFMLIDVNQSVPLSTLSVTVPPRGTVSVTVRPRPDARDGDSSAIHIDGAGEHQEVDLRVQRFVAHASALVQPEPPKILNWIVALIVLLLIAAAVLAKYFVKKPGVRFVCYAAIVHLIIFSLAMPQKAIMDAMPQAFEVSLLDAQESLGMSMSDQQSRRLDALHMGGGVGDDKRAPVLAEAALPEKSGPVDLPTPGAGLASPRPGPLNLDAARGVERPSRPAEVPEAARGAVNAPVMTDAPLAFDTDMPAMTVKPAAAEKVSIEAPRAAKASFQSNAEALTIPTQFATASIVERAPTDRTASAGIVRQVSASAAMERRTVLPEKTDASFDSGRRSLREIDDAPLSTSSDAPLAFDALPVSAPQVKQNVHAPPADAVRNVPVSANESGLGATGLAALNASLAPLTLSGAGAHGPSGTGSGESRVALARTGALPVADASAGVGHGMGGASVGNSVSDALSGTGFGREGGGLPSGGQEPLAIGTNGGDGPGAKASGPGFDGGAGGSGSGNGNSLIGGTRTGDGKAGSGEPAAGSGIGGPGRTSAAGGGGLGGGGTGLATGGTGNGSADFGLPNGDGSAWHGRPGGKGAGSSLAPGLSSAQLEGGNGGGRGGNGAGGIPNGSGSGPGGRVPGGVGINGDGPGGTGDKPLAIGPPGGGGIKPSGSGISSGGGDVAGRGGGGGYSVGRSGPAGGTSLDGVGGLGGIGVSAGASNGIAGGNGRPSDSAGKHVSIGRAMDSKALEDAGVQGSKGAAAIPGLPHRGLDPAYTGGMIRIAVGLAKHSGDWNSSPIALKNLRGAFIERSRLPELEVTIPEVELSDLSAMMKCRTIMITSNLPVTFKPNEIEAIRAYIAAGGTLWVNDSTDRSDEIFDTAFRPQVPLLVPGATLEKMPVAHDFFVACYDLSHGYKGYRVPPGDKYRLDYIEAAFIPEPAKVAAKDSKKAGADVVELADDTALNHRRAGLIYTRNDYSDGLQQNPLTNDGMDSLTDLTKSEMLESSLRFGMNLIAYSMGPQGLKLPAPPDTVAEFEKTYRYKGPALPVLDDFKTLTDQWNKPTWVAESKDFFNESALEFIEDKAAKKTLAQVSFKPGEKFKAAISRFGGSDLARTRALVFDIHSGFVHGINVSLMFYSKDKKVYESRPVFVRPGWNRDMRFPLDMNDMKSSAAAEPWKNYDTAFEPRNAVERISVLIYNLKEAGVVKVGPIREEK